tara:strand:- start:36718 stop:37632 length:915 start_codon:yes stop_codon:yes gene_type:complete
MSKVSIDEEEYKELQKYKWLFINLMQQTNDFIYFKDCDFNFTYASRPFLELTQQKDVKQLSGKSDFDVFDLEHATHYRKMDEQVMAGNPLTNHEESYIDLNENLCWVSTSKNLLLSENNSVIGIFGISRDVTENKAMKQELEHRANVDSLTQLSNRNAFLVEASVLLKIASRDKKQLSLYFIDLDDFKYINDKYGHEAGDHVLQVVSRRVKEHFRQTDVICRWGGDEFIILAMTDSEHAEKLCQRLTKNIRDDILWNEKLVNVGCSIGVDINIDVEKPLSQVIKESDEAMYRAKRNCKGSYAVV